MSCLVIDFVHLKHLNFPLRLDITISRHRPSINEIRKEHAVVETYLIFNTLLTLLKGTSSTRALYRLYVVQA